MRSYLVLHCDARRPGSLPKCIQPVALPLGALQLAHPSWSLQYLSNSEAPPLVAGCNALALGALHLAHPSWFPL